MTERNCYECRCAHWRETPAHTQTLYCQLANQEIWRGHMWRKPPPHIETPEWCPERKEE